MRALAAAVLVLLVLGLLGWFTLFAGDDEVGAQINTDTVAEDVGTAAEAVSDGAKKVKEEVEKTDVDVDIERD